MRIVGDSPSPPSAQDPAARRARLRWLAKRRCLRALRTTLVFMALVTPFLFFGYVLCCRMPFGINRIVPNGMFLYACWLLLHNARLFFRHVRITPLLASLPLLLTLYYIIAYPPGPYASINENLYFQLFKEERLALVHLIEKGEIGDAGRDLASIRLKEPYTHLAMQGGRIVYRIKDGQACVVFSTGWNFLSFDQGFCYIPDNIPGHWLGMDRLVEYEKIEELWYIIFPQVTYFENILDTPPKRSPTPQVTPQRKFLPRPEDTDRDQKNAWARFRSHFYR